MPAEPQNQTRLQDQVRQQLQKLQHLQSLDPPDQKAITKLIEQITPNLNLLLGREILVSTLGDSAEVTQLLSAVETIELTTPPDLPMSVVPTNLQAAASTAAPSPAVGVKKYLAQQRDYLEKFTALRQLQLSLEKPLQDGLRAKLEAKNIPPSQARRIVQSQMGIVNNLVWRNLVSGHQNPDALVEQLVGSFNLAGSPAIRYGLGDSPLPQDTQRAIKKAVADHAAAVQSVLLDGSDTPLSRSQASLISPAPVKAAMAELSRELIETKNPQVINEQIQNLKTAFTPLPIQMALAELADVAGKNPTHPRIKVILNDLSHYLGPTNAAVDRLVQASKNGRLTPNLVNSAAPLMGNRDLNQILDSINIATPKNSDLTALKNFQNLRPPDVLEELAVWGLAQQGIAESVARPTAQNLKPMLQALSLSQDLAITPENAKEIYAQIMSTGGNRSALATLGNNPQFIAAFGAAAAHYSAHPEIALNEVGINRLDRETLNRLSQFLTSQGVDSSNADPNTVTRLTLQYFRSLGSNPAEMSKLDPTAYQNMVAALKTRETFAEAFYANLTPEALEQWGKLREARDRASAKWQQIKKPYTWVLDKHSQYTQFIDNLPLAAKDWALDQIGVPKDARQFFYRRDYLEFIERWSGKTLIPKTGWGSWVRSPKGQLFKWVGGKTKWLTEPISQGWAWVKALPGRGLKYVTDPIKNLINRLATKLWTALKPIVEKVVTVITDFISTAVKWLGQKLAVVAGKALAALGALISPEVLAVMAGMAVATLIIISVFHFWRYYSNKRLASAQLTPIGQGGTEDPNGYIANICTIGEPDCPALNCPDCSQPVNCGAVSQCPGDNFSHENLNAIDFGMVGCTLDQMGVYFTLPYPGTISAVHMGNAPGTGSGYGNFIDVTFTDPDTGRQFLVRYAHLQQSAVNEGDSVSSGDLLGVADHTGFSTNPHLHFELRSADGGSAPSITTLVPGACT